jgi:hypothetical protein
LTGVRPALRALVVPLVAAAPLAAQGASPYVPLDHWTMPYVEHLIATGAIADPAPLTRPLRRADVVAALGAADTLALGAAARGSVRRLLRALDARDTATGPRYRVAGDIGLAAASYAKRDPLAALDDTGPRAAGPGHATATGGLDLEAAFGPVVAVSHPYFDTRLKYDPDWFGKKDRVIAGRTAEAYVAAQWRVATLFFGRLDRNWGPSAVQGLFLSDQPYGLDHLAVTLGTARFQVQAVATQLDDRRDSTGAVVHRYLMAHRVWARPGARWTLALWEGSVLAGPARAFEPWYLNIANLGLLEQLNGGGNVNSFVGLDVERRARTTFFAQFLLDDIQVDRRAPADQKPMSYGFTLGAKGGVRGGAAAWTAFYTQVANLTYRNENDLEVPLYHFLGTGRNFADYDQVTLRASALVAPGLLLAPELTLVRQGEGDPRLPHPPVSAYPATATIFQGVVERTWRVAVAGTYAPGAGFGVTCDAGLHRIMNFQHVPGAVRTRAAGRVAVSYRFRWQGTLP